MMDVKYLSLRKIRILAVICLGILLVAVASDAAHAARIKDIANIRGVRQNQLFGYGLVVGLDGSGDGNKSLFTVQSLASMLEKMGVTIDPDDLKVKNVAAVMITADLPPFARTGSRIELTGPMLIGRQCCDIDHVERPVGGLARVVDDPDRHGQVEEYATDLQNRRIADDDHVVFVFLYFVRMAHRSGSQGEFHDVDQSQGHQHVGAGTRYEVQRDFQRGAVHVVLDDHLQPQHGVVQDDDQQQPQ